MKFKSLKIASFGKINHLLLFIFSIISLSATAQIKSINSEVPKHSFSIGTQPGIIVPTSAFVRGRNAERKPMWFYEGLYLRMSFGTSGKTDWQQLYNNPSFGFGGYLANLHNEFELGYPFAVFGFVDVPVLMFKRFPAVFEFGGGIAYNWKYYSPENQWNMSFGMPASVYLDFSLSTEYKLGKRTRLQAGISSTHYSNGGLKQPNHGITTFTPKFTLLFDSKKTITLAETIIPEKLMPSYEYEIAVFGGTKNVLINLKEATFDDKYNGRYYPLYGATGLIYRTISRKGKLGLGINTTYNAASNLAFYWINNEVISSTPNLSYQMHVSIFPSYEISMGRASAFLQPAMYIFKRNLTDKTSWFYARTGLRFYMLKNTYFGVNLKVVEGFFPDYLEWTIGFGRMKLKK